MTDDAPVTGHAHATGNATAHVRWNDRVAWGLHEAAFAVFLATAVFAPAALGSTYPWSLLGLRWGVAATVALVGLSLMVGRAPRPLTPTRAATSGATFANRADGATAPIEVGEPVTIRSDAVTSTRSLHWIAGAWTAYLVLLVTAGWQAGATFDVTQATSRTVTAMMAFPLAAFLVRGPRHATALAITVLATAAGLATYGVMQAFGYGVTPSYSGAGRVSSVYFNANHYAGFLDLVVPLAAAVAVFASRRSVRWVAAGLTMLGLVNVVASQSRGSWVAITASLALLAVVATWKGLRGPRPLGVVRTWLAVLVLATSVGFASTRWLPDWTARTVSRFERLVDDLRHPREFERVAIVLAGLPIVEEHPWWGVGPGNFSLAITRHRPSVVDDANDGMLHQFVNYAHNDYLQVATETGVPSLMAFVAFWLLAVLLPSPRSPPLAWGWRLGLIALLVHGLVDGNLTVIPSNAFLAHAAVGCLHARWRWRRRTLA